MRFLVILMIVFCYAQPGFASGGGGGGHGGGGGGGSSAAEDPILKDLPKFIKVPPFSIPVIQEGRAKKFMIYNVVLEVKNEPEKIEKVTKELPKLQDGFFRYLYSLGNSTFAKHMTDLDFVKDGLKKMSDRLLGEGMVDAVLVTSTTTKKIVD